MRAIAAGECQVVAVEVVSIIGRAIAIGEAIATVHGHVVLPRLSYALPLVVTGEGIRALEADGMIYALQVSGAAIKRYSAEEVSRGPAATADTASCTI